MLTKKSVFVIFMIIMYHKFMYRFNWIIIPWYITLKIYNEAKPTVSGSWIIKTVFYCLSCNVQVWIPFLLYYIFQSSIFKCSDEFDSSSFHHYLVRTLLHVFWYYYITLLQIHYHIEQFTILIKTPFRISFIDC